MKYDDIAWHYGPRFPEDLPDSAAATQAGMFLAWAILFGLGADRHYEEFEEAVERLQSRDMTPGEYLLEVCGGRLSDRDLNQEGNAFARDYVTLEAGSYLRDYERHVAAELPSVYHVTDSWQTYDTLAPLIQRRYEAWKAEHYGP